LPGAKRAIFLSWCPRILDGRTLELLPLEREMNARGLRCGGARLYRLQSDEAEPSALLSR